jgi:hypothetical protein
MENILDTIKDLKRRVEELEKRNVPNMSIPDPLSVSQINTDTINEKTSENGTNINGVLTKSGEIILSNNKSIYAKNNVGTAKSVVKVNASNVLEIGNSSLTKTLINNNLEVNGLISGKNSAPLTAQKVHERILFGWVRMDI